jgi:bifunctional DNA-binding transcriptional regulator/antitoxin component of YhaV-PrlF toxin-antitoxin module
MRMSENKKEIIIGTSTIDPRYRITLIKPIPEFLDADIGDLIVFVKDDKDNIILKPSKVSELKRK